VPSASYDEAELGRKAGLTVQCVLVVELNDVGRSYMRPRTFADIGAYVRTKWLERLMRA